jgi:cellobiose epimerase
MKLMNTHDKLLLFRREVREELKRILQYWETYTVDNQRGGFYGRVTFENKPVADAPRAVVITSRILWTFSMAYRQFRHHRHLAMADRAYHYLQNHFRDTLHGGVYWSVTANGEPLETRKQLYGNAFAIYGLSEYYAASRFKPALEFAKELFQVIDKHGFDPQYGGYWEAFARDWQPIDDMILTKSPYGKTMNTHLHLLEAFTNLYRVWPDSTLRQRLENMMDVFLTRIINPETHHLRLFMTKDWQSKDEVISYGHDIEASWLLYETAEVLRDEKLMKRVADISIKMAEATVAGLGTDGALNYEYDPATKNLNTERSWWVLAEQMVGFLNAFQLTKAPHFLDKAEQSWKFIKAFQRDATGGEWHIAVKADHEIPKNDKVTFWKCPYHNARACQETMRRLGDL